MASVSEGRARAVLAEYELALGRAPLAAHSRRAYLSRVAGYLRWLTGADLGGADPLGEPRARDIAVAAYRAWLSTNPDRKPTTVNAVLTALDHFYSHLHLGPALGDREPRPAEAGPRVLDQDEQRRFLAAVESHDSVRDRAIAYALFFTGVRVGELVALDLADVRLRARPRRLIVWEGKGAGYREVPLSTEPRPTLRQWVYERDAWRGSDGPAFFLNRRGGRLSTRSVDDLVARLGRAAGIVDTEERPTTPHVLRHTYGSRLLGGGADVPRVAELMGHKRLETTRQYAMTPPA